MHRNGDSRRPAIVIYDVQLGGEGAEVDRDRAPNEAGRVTCESLATPGPILRLTFDDEGNLIGFEIGPAAMFGLDPERVAREGGRLIAAPRITDGLVTARLLRAIPLGEIEVAARGALQRQLDSLDQSEHPLVRNMIGVAGRRYLDTLGGTSDRPGRRGRGDVHYAAIASAYVSHLGSGREVTELADELHLGRATVRNALSEARRRGLLTRPRPGKSGGHLTDKAKQVLTREEHENGIR